MNEKKNCTVLKYVNDNIYNSISYSLWLTETDFIKVIIIIIILYIIKIDT